jgi:hypothetical protein
MWCSVDINRVFQQKAFIIRTTVSSQLVPSPSVTVNLEGQIDNQQVVQNMLLRMARLRNSRSQIKSYQLAKVESDISAFVNNESVQALNAGVSVENVPSQWNKQLVNRQVANLHEAGDETAVLDKLAWSTGTVRNATTTAATRKLMLDMIMRSGIDPSYVAVMHDRSLTSKQQVDGTVRQAPLAKTNDEDHTSQTRLLNFHVASNVETTPNTSGDIRNTSKIVQVLESTLQKSYVIPIDVQFSIADLPYDVVEVKFELLNAKRQAIDTVVVRLPVHNHYSSYRYPIKAPKVSLSRGKDDSDVTLEITNLDDKTSGIKLLRKTIQRTISSIDDYAEVGDFDLSPGSKRISIPVVGTWNSYVILRVIPYGVQGELSNEFTNVVIRPKKVYQLTSISLVTKIVDTGIQLELRRIPYNVTSVQFLVRNKTLHETRWSFLGSPQVISEETRAIDTISVVDTHVKNQRIYEYSAKLFYDNGEEEQCGSALLEFIKPQANIVDTKVTNVTTHTRDDDGETNVSFLINTQLLDNNFDMLHGLLKVREIDAFFSNEVEKERALFKKLVAHNVQRVNIVTGEREDFGVITSESFDDAKMRVNSSVKPLDEDYAYRYEIYPLLRSPETLFKTFNKQVVDQRSKRPYVFNPAKFLHPLAHDTGTLYTPLGTQMLSSKSDFSHGVLGNVVAVDATFGTNTFNIENVDYSWNDHDTIKLSWQTEGDMTAIDHFLVSKDVMGIRTIIGKTHSSYLHNNVVFLHHLNKNDIGAFRYVVTAITNDYQVVGNVGVSDVVEVTNVNG